MIQLADPTTLLGSTSDAKLSAPASCSWRVQANRSGCWPRAQRPFRSAPTDPAQTALDFAYAGLPDQVNCVLRSVGTFGKPAAPDFVGVVPMGAPAVHEVRRVLSRPTSTRTRSRPGATGFNIPSLLGLASGAPYFHAGNARTLEELFDQVFKDHICSDGRGRPDGQMKCRPWSTTCSPSMRILRGQRRLPTVSIRISARSSLPPPLVSSLVARQRIGSTTAAGSSLHPCCTRSSGSSCPRGNSCSSSLRSASSRTSRLCLRHARSGCVPNGSAASSQCSHKQYGLQLACGPCQRTATLVSNPACHEGDAPCGKL